MCACVCVCCVWARVSQLSVHMSVDNAVSEEVMVGIMDNAYVETPDVTREEVEKAMTKLKNGI